VDDEDIEALDDRERYETCERYEGVTDRRTNAGPDPAAASANAARSALGDDPDVERDAPEAKPPHRDVDQPR
jgi:hypothetical protein